MKKKLFIVAALLLSLTLGFSVGVLAFSKDNLSNTAADRVSVTYTQGNGLTLVNWWGTDDVAANERGEVYSNTDPQLVIEGVNCYVYNLRLDIQTDRELTSVEVFYTEQAGESFSGEKSMICPVEKKNDDLYVRVDREVADVRIDLFEEFGVKVIIRGIELNPRGLNVNTFNLIILSVLPFVIGWSVIEIIYDRKSFVKDLAAMKRYKYLLYDLVTKDIKTKYRRSFLGVLWSVLNPLLMMLVLTAVFSNIIRVQVEGGFALFYLTGYIMFNFLSESTSFSLYTITGAAPLIKKVYIPKYVFPLEKCIFSFVNMLFSMIAFVIVFIVFCFTGGVEPHLSMLLFPLPMIYIFIFSLGLCLALSALVVFFRDIGHIWGILLTVWMYASPIIYPIDLVPEWLAGVIRLNPLYHFIDYFRNVMIYGRVPDLSDNLVCLIFSVTALLFGAVVFRKSQDKFILHI